MIGNLLESIPKGGESGFDIVEAQANQTKLDQNLRLLQRIRVDFRFSQQHLGQFGRAVKLPEHPLQRRQHRGLVARRFGCLAIEIERTLEVPERPLVQLAQPQSQGSLQGRVIRGAEAIFVDGSERLPITARRHEPFQRLPRFAVGRLFGESARPSGKDAPWISAFPFLDQRDLRQDFQARSRGVLRFQFQFEQIDQLGPFGAGAQQGLQSRDGRQPEVVTTRDPPQRLPRLLMLRAARYDPAIATDGAFHVGEIVGEQSRRAHRDRVADRRIRFNRGSLIQNLEQVGVLPLPGQDPIQKLQDLDVPGWISRIALSWASAS